MNSILAPTVLLVITVVLAIVLVPRFRLGLPPFRTEIDRLIDLGFSPAVVVFTFVSALVVAHGLAIALASLKHQYGMALGIVLLAWIGSGRGLKMTIKFRERLLRNQISSAAMVMSGASRAGMAPAVALARAAADSSTPLAPQLLRICRDYDRGATLRSAMLARAERLNLDAFTLFTTAITVTLECGGRLEESLDRISESVGDQQRLNDKLDAATSSSRTALTLMAMFPFGFTAFMYQLDAAGFNAISQTLAGQLGICGVLLIIYFALRWGTVILDRVGT